MAVIIRATAQAVQIRIVMSEEQCECHNWARTDQAMFLTKHHPNCDNYDPESDAIELLKELTDGIESWSQETDGVYPELWDAYVKAKYAIGEGHEVNLDAEAV